MSTHEIDPQWIDAARTAFWAALHDLADTDLSGRDYWNTGIDAAIAKAAPLIAARAAADALTQASQNLTDWAAESGTDPARRMRRLTIEAAARKILPKMTNAEAAAAFADVLSGRAPGFVCHLDDAAAIARRDGSQQ